MTESGNGSGWNIQRKDAVYAALLALSFGGEQAIDRNRVPTIDKEAIERVERSVAELRDPGGPKLRETVQRVTALEAQNTSQQQAIDALNNARYSDLRNGVSQETINDLRARLTDDREATKDLKAQIETLRTAIDNLRNEILRATTARLRGPN